MERMIKSKLLLHCFAAVLSFALTLGIFLFFKLSLPFSELLFVLSMAGMMFLIEAAIPAIRKKNAITSGIFSAVLSASIVVGEKIHFWYAPYYATYTKSDFLYWLVFGAVLFFAVIDLFQIIRKFTIESTPRSRKITFWFAVFGVLLVCWLPYFILYYPGNLTGDSYSSINQSIGITPLNNHCPVLFTLFVKACLKTGLLFGSLNFAVGIFSFAQMLAMAAILSYSVYWLSKKNLPNYVIVLTALFYALNPVIAMYAATMWKDILFSGWMLLLTLLLFDILESNGAFLLHPKGLASFSICCLLVAFGRNNGIYVVAAVFLALGIYLRRYLKLLVPVFLSVLLVITAVQGPLYTALGIGKSEFAESVGIPLQQIGYTLKYDGKVTEDQKEFLDQILPAEKIKEVYNPESPDYIKFNPEFNNQFLENNKGKFIKVWAEMLIPNFKSYVKAYLAQTIGYWHIGTTNWICQFGVDENSTGLPITQHGILQNRIEMLVKGLKYIPVLRDLFSIAFMVWLTFFCCVILILKRNYKYILAVLPLLAVWATMMIAVPTFCEFRYMYSFHLILPFVFLMIFLTYRKSNPSGEPIKKAAQIDNEVNV